MNCQGIGESAQEPEISMLCRDEARSQCPEGDVYLERAVACNSGAAAPAAEGSPAAKHTSF